MGKEIYTRFHATLWPAMLMALGLPLPRHVVGHGWWLIGGEKGSKSKGNIPLPQDVVARLEARSGAAHDVCVDALRYYLLRDIQFSSDTDFSEEMLATRYNADLANDLGNVLNRVLGAKYFEGRIPDPGGETSALRASAEAAVAAYETALARFDWGAALLAAGQLIKATNAFLAERAPWTLARNGDRAGVNAVVYAALEAVRIGAVLLAPAMPAVAREINRQLGIAETSPDGAWAAATRWGGLVPGAPTGAPAPIFPRIDTKKGAAAPPPPRRTLP
jgi:methionyl-tRNA synthetase